MLIHCISMILVMHFGWEENVRAFQRGSEQNENLVLACTLKNGIVLVSLLMPLQSLGFCLDWAKTKMAAAPGLVAGAAAGRRAGQAH